MSMTVTQLIDQAAVQLQDEEHIRWTKPELLEYFNAAQRALAEHRPDQVSELRDKVLDAGWHQTLDAGVSTLVGVVHNVSPKQGAITFTSMQALDAVMPAWRSARPRDEVVHYMHDLKSPNEFAVYPPVNAGVTVRVLVALAPIDLASESDPVSVPLRWMDALLYFVLYRAWSKDAQYGANPALAKAYLDLFNNAIGVQSQAAVAMASPKE